MGRPSWSRPRDELTPSRAGNPLRGPSGWCSPRRGRRASCAGSRRTPRPRSGRRHGRGPDTVQDLRLRDDRAALLHEVGQQVELARRQVDVRVRTAHQVGGRVEDESPGGELGGAFGATTTGQGAQTGVEDDEAEGLGQVVVGAEVEGVGLVPFAVLGGEHQDGGPHVLGAHLLEDVVAVHQRQHDVEDHHVVLAVDGLDATLASVAGQIDDVALTGEASAGHLGERTVVLHQQQSHLTPSARGSHATRPSLRGVHRPICQHCVASSR